MTTKTETAVTTPALGISDLTRRGAVALFVALAVNMALVLLANVAGIAPRLDPLNYGPVVLFTTLGIVGATLTYAALTRFVANPDRTFTVVAGIVLVLSIIPDVVFVPTLPGATTAGAALLAFMHVTAGAAAIVYLTDLPTRRRATR